MRIWLPRKKQAAKPLERAGCAVRQRGFTCESLSVRRWASRACVQTLAGGIAGTSGSTRARTANNVLRCLLANKVGAHALDHDSVRGTDGDRGEVQMPSEVRFVGNDGAIMRVHYILVCADFKRGRKRVRRSGLWRRISVGKQRYTTLQVNALLHLNLVQRDGILPLC